MGPTGDFTAVPCTCMHMHVYAHVRQGPGSTVGPVRRGQRGTPGRQGEEVSWNKIGLIEEKVCVVEKQAGQLIRSELK